MQEPLIFTCSHCGQAEELQDDSLYAIVNQRREQVMGMLSNDGNRSRGYIAFEGVKDEETGKTRLVARRRLPGVEIKEG